MKTTRVIFATVLFLLSGINFIYAQASLMNLTNDIPTDQRSWSRNAKRCVMALQGGGKLDQATILAGWDKLDGFRVNLANLKDEKDPVYIQAMDAFKAFEDTINQTIIRTNSQDVVDQIAKDTKLPEKAADNPNLIATAKDLIKGECGEIVKIFINYDVHQKEDKGWKDDGTYYYIKWEEFQVTTVEKVDGKYWMRIYEFHKTLEGGEKLSWYYSSRPRNRTIAIENVN